MTTYHETAKSIISNSESSSWVIKQWWLLNTRDPKAVLNDLKTLTKLFELKLKEEKQ